MKTNLLLKMVLLGIMLVSFSISENAIAKNAVLRADDTECFTPAYSDRQNLVPDPYCNSLDGFGGWGNKSVNYDPDYVYCGASSVVIPSRWSGTFEITGLSANTVYRFIAKTYATSGSIVKFALYGHNMGEGDLTLFLSTQENVWQTADFTFKTGESGGGVYFVSESGGSVYIDNYEVYVVQEPQVTIKYQDTDGNMLKEDHVITSSWGMNVPGFITIGKKYTASVSDKNEIEKDGNFYHYDAQNSTDHVMITEGNNEIILKFSKSVPPSDNSDLADLSVPGGTLHPTFDTETFIYTVKLPSETMSIIPVVTRAEPGQTLSGDGVVDVTSGEGSSVITVTSEDQSSSKTYTINYIVTPSDDTFVPTYSDRSILSPDPYCDSLEGFGGWGSKSVNTNPDYIYSGPNSITVGGGFSGTLELTGLPENTVFRFIVKDYAPAGAVAKFGWYNHKLGGGDIDLIRSSINDTWETLDFTFKTGEEGSGIYYVSESGGNVYIDNYEVYFVDEPQITIKYQDLAGNTLKADRFVISDWDIAPSAYLMIGKTYTVDDSDKETIAYNGKNYSYDATSTDHVMIEEGENTIILKFSQDSDIPEIIFKNKLEISNSSNGISIRSDRNIQLPIFTSDGKLTKIVQVKEGINNIFLSHGLYVIDGQLCVVR